MRSILGIAAGAVALCAALATGGCWLLFGDDEEDQYQHYDTDTDPVTCDDEGYWPGDFYAYDAASLQQLAGCRYVQGDLIVQGTSLFDLHGLEGIEQIGGSLRIGENPLLLSADGLERLAEVDGEVAVHWNGALRDLDGLGDLVAIGGGLAIRENAALESIAGLGELRFLGGAALVVEDNPIPYCEIEELADRLVGNGFAGAVDISGTGTTECDEPDGGAGDDAGVAADGGLDGGA